MSEAIRAESVSKKFLVRTNRPRSLRESMIKRFRGQHDPGKTIWALRDVNFKVQQGQALGILGHNGAGKSTLLRLLCGIGRPTEGSFYRSGPVSGLLELGSSFHPMMTGRENIRTAAMLNGLSRRQVQRLEQEMIEFAELEEFIDQPVRTYSNGMCLRLAFASAIHMNPEILVIDEILVVGDMRFQQKCKERLSHFRREGKTLILTTHEMDQIETLCDEALILEEGKLLTHSDPKTAIGTYKDLMRQRTERRTAHLSTTTVIPPLLQPIEGYRTGTLEVVLKAVHFYDDNGDAAEAFVSGNSVTVEMEIQPMDPAILDFAITLGIFAKNDVKCFETYISSVKDTLGSCNGERRIRCRIPNLPLAPGEYYTNIGIYPTNWDFTYDYHREMHAFRIAGQANQMSGIMALNPKWSILP